MSGRSFLYIGGWGESQSLGDGWWFKRGIWKRSGLVNTLAIRALKRLAEGVLCLYLVHITVYNAMNFSPFKLFFTIV